MNPGVAGSLIVNCLVAGERDFGQMMQRDDTRNHSPFMALWIYMKTFSVQPAPEIASDALVSHDAPISGFDLELPDAPDFISRRRALSLEQMLPLLEERRRWFPLSPSARALRNRSRVTAEFIL